MKKFRKASIILAGSLSCLCICTSNVVIAKTNPTETAVTDDSTKGDNIIKFDPAYTVIDDDNVKMQVESIQKEISNEGTELEFTEYSVNLNIENKNKEHDMDCTVATTDCYVDGYTVTFSYSNTKTKSGKKNDTAAYTCGIYTKNEQASAQGSEHIKTLEDLLTFEASVSVSLYDDTGKTHNIVDRYPVDISLAEAANDDNKEGTDADKKK